MIQQYHVVSEEGKCWLTCTDLDTAKDWIELANSGGCGRMGWRGTSFHLEVTELPPQQETTWYF